MDPGDVAFIKGVIGLAMLAGTGLAGYWLRTRARALPDAGLRDEVARLRAEVEQLQEVVQVRIPEVEERIDFVERRPVGSEGPSRPDRHATPV